MSTDIIIHKFKNGNISLKLLNKNKISPLDGIINSNDLFNEDLYFFMAGDGWKYIIDTNIEKVYQLTNYGFDLIGDLLSTNFVRLYPMSETDAAEILIEWDK
ncbi:hypothetical protein KAR91_61200 [Candidatus Pacearchaeota archaeon]|nr:hypothetical protein [Candidatus Pacearchaeota archaeon]